MLVPDGVAEAHMVDDRELAGTVRDKEGLVVPERLREGEGEGEREPLPVPETRDVTEVVAEREGDRDIEGDTVPDCVGVEEPLREGEPVSERLRVPELV